MSEKCTKYSLNYSINAKKLIQWQFQTSIGQCKYDCDYSYAKNDMHASKWDNLHFWHYFGKHWKKISVHNMFGNEFNSENTIKNVAE